jgi:hypothetical protein
MQMTFGEGEQLKAWVLNPQVQQLLQQAREALDQGMPDEELSHMMATWLKVSEYQNLCKGAILEPHAGHPLYCNVMQLKAGQHHALDAVGALVYMQTPGNPAGQGLPNQLCTATLDPQMLATALNEHVGSGQTYLHL